MKRILLELDDVDHSRLLLKKGQQRTWLRYLFDLERGFDISELNNEIERNESKKNG